MSASTDPATAVALGMARHPAGGWYRRLWTAATPALLTGRSGRAATSAVQHLLCPGEVSAWYRTGAEELWLHQDGGPVVLQWGGAGPDPVLVGTVAVGPGDAAALHALVPGRTWRRPLPVAQEALVTLVASPEFTFEDFEVR